MTVNELINSSVLVEAKKELKKEKRRSGVMENHKEQKKSKKKSRRRSVIPASTTAKIPAASMHAEMPRGSTPGSW